MRAGRVALVAAGPLTSACRPPCLDLDQVPILSQQAPDPAAWQQEIAATLSDFAAWSGPGTCLSAVSVGLPAPVQGDPRSEGAFDRWQRRIHLAPDLEIEALRPVLLHELCHAWDASRGFLSDDHPGLFPASDLPAAYPASSHRQGPAAREVFAFTCGAGPLDPELVASLDAGGCDAGITPGWRFVLDEVYPYAPAASPLPLGWAAPASIHRVPIDDPPAPRIYDLAFVGDGLWILSLEHAPATWQLSRLDLLSGALDPSRPLPPTDPLPTAFLVPGPDQGLFVARWGEQWTAYGLPADSGGPVLAPPAGPAPSWEPGALVLGDRLWQLFGDALVERDLVDGRSEWHPLPEALRGIQNRSLHARRGGLGFVATLGGHAIQGFTNGATEWSWADSPSRRPVVELPGGRLLGGGDLRGLLLPSLDLEGWRRPEADLLALIEPEASAYQLGGCLPPALSASGTGDLGAHLSSDGMAWLLGEDADGLVLLAVAPAGGLSSARTWILGGDREGVRLNPWPAVP